MNSTLRVAQDTFTREDRPAVNFGQEPQITVGAAASAIRRGFLYAPVPFPRGASIISATLRVWTRDIWSGGPTTVKARRVTTRWRENVATWNEEPTAVATNEASTVIANNAAVGTLVEFDVAAIMQDVAAGGAYHGLRLGTADAVTHRFHSAESATDGQRPKLLIEWTLAPTKPVDLKPSGGLAIGLASPTLTWRHVDTAGEEQAQFQVQLDDASDFATVLHDSGWVVSGDSEYLLPVTVPADATRYWRVRTRDTYGISSPWSDTASFIRKVKGVVTISSPTNGGTVDDHTPNILHSFSGTQQSARWLLERRNEALEWERIYDSGVLTTAATSHTIPKGYITKTTDTYRIRVRIFDSQERVAIPGESRYAEATATFTYVRSGTPTEVLTLTVEAATVADEMPGTVLTWTRASAPDYFAIVVDGEIIDGRLEPGDTFVSGTTYRTVLYSLIPLISHTVEVEAVSLVSGSLIHSDGNPVVNYTPTISGIWLVAPDWTLNCVIAGREPNEKRIGEEGETFFPLNRRDPVRIKDSTRGYEGSLRGQLAPIFERTGLTWRDRLEQIKGLPARATIWLIFADNAYRITLGEVSITNRHPDIYEITAEFWQTADFTIPLRR